jgi:urease accessory protein
MSPASRSGSEALDAKIQSTNADATGWCARLSLDYQPANGRTKLGHRKHCGPILVQRPFYPEGEVCHTYIVHPPGGVVSGDRIDIDVGVAAHAHALLTTPAATKYYRAKAGNVGAQRQHLRVDADATLEWLPQESIFYPSTAAHLDTVVDLSTGSRFIGWEYYSAGFPQLNRGLDDGRVKMGLRVNIDGGVHYQERRLLGPESDRGDVPPASAWRLARYPVQGTLIGYPISQVSLAHVQNSIGGGLEQGSDAVVSATALDELLVCRIMSDRTSVVSRWLHQQWHSLRMGILNRTTCPPRIWST